MEQALEKSNEINRNDEIDLFDLLEVLWKSKIIIITFTFISLSIGLIYSQTRVTTPPAYKVSIQAHQSSDITTSILLSKLWGGLSKDDSLSFSTQGMEKYKLSNNPYSPNALFIRALERTNSFEQKALYLKEKKIELDLEVSFPKTITGIFEISLTTHNKAETDILKNQIVEYIQWSLNRFNQSLIKEAKLLDSNLQLNELSVPFYITNEVNNSTLMEKPKTGLIAMLSLLLGMILGCTLALLKNAIKTRYT